MRVGAERIVLTAPSSVAAAVRYTKILYFSSENIQMAISFSKNSISKKINTELPRIKKSAVEQISFL